MQRGEHLYAALKDPFHICDGRPIVRDRDSCIFGAAQAVFHLPLVQSAAAAVDDEAIFT